MRLTVRRYAVAARTERARPALLLRRRAYRRLLRLLWSERALLLVRRRPEGRLLSTCLLTTPNLGTTGLTTSRFTTTRLTATSLASGLTSTRLTSTDFASGLTTAGLASRFAVVLRPLLFAVRRLLWPRQVAVSLLWLLCGRGWRSRQVRRLRDVRLLGHRAAFVSPGGVRQRWRRVETETVGPVPPGVVAVIRAAALLGCPALRSGPVRRRQFVVVLGTGRQEVVSHGFIVPPLRRVSATACG
ncbi:hypothetical protein AB0F43_03290 [Kribbella sp. NPDC023972]|uniref:hypothetical protein n=1 Tax=Kribbella sp. NPDC023972 TaxID=3154795 RepID=UPI0033FC1685